MTAEEASMFEQGEMFELCKQMRTWDEMAKVPGLAVPDLETYKERCGHLSQRADG